MRSTGSRALIVAFILFALSPSAWAAFGYSSPFTIDHTQVPSTQTNFPVLISVTDARLKTVGNSGHVQNANGYDIRPYSDSTCSTALTYELERYNATSGEVVMWVKVASLSSSVDTVITLAYGDGMSNHDGSSTATWSSSFVSVYHLADGTTLNVNDSLGTHNGTNHSATATTGKIDGGGGFVSASSQYIDLGSVTGPSVDITLSCWVNGTSFPNAYNAVFGRGTTDYWIIRVKSTGKLAWYVKTAGGNVAFDGTGSHTLSTGTWYYLTMSYSDSTGLATYVNAASDHTPLANGLLSTTAGNVFIGEDSGTAGRYWNGVIDEVRFASVVRSANWITTEYNNQVAPGTFMVLGTEVSGCGATPTSTPTATATFTPTATATFTPTPSATFTPTPSATFTPTPTATFTPTPSATFTPTPTATPGPWLLFFPQNG